MALRAERKLAAILAADVVGYSRLVGEDEAGTHARLRTHRNEFVEPVIAEHRGRVVKLTGDAAHPMMPFYAQGAGQSIDDAYILAGCLALRPDEPVAALERYVRLRQPRTAWIQQLSRREEELYHIADPAGIARRNTTLRQNQSSSAAAFPPEQECLYNYDAEAILRS
jgi:salicylate hydroxylase